MVHWDALGKFDLQRRCSQLCVWVSGASIIFAKAFFLEAKAEILNLDSFYYLQIDFLWYRICLHLMPFSFFKIYYFLHLWLHF